MSVKGRKARLAVTAGLAAALALGGVVAPVAQAYADSGYTVTIESTTGYTVEGQYKVYRLFTGSFADTNTDNGKMGNAVANDNYREDMRTVLNGFLADANRVPAVDATHSKLVVDTAIADGIAGLPDAKKQEFANKLAAALKDKAGFTSVNAENGTLSVTGLEAGYYLIVNPDVENNAMTSAILVPVNHNRTVSIKTSTPTVTKQVKVNNEGYKKNTDVGLTSATAVEKLTYKLEGTVASNIDDYGAYKYVFKDTLPKGVTADADRVAQWNVTCKVACNGAEYAIPEGRFAVSFATNSTANTTEISWTCANLVKAMNDAGLSSNHGDASIILEYTPNYTAEELRNALPNAGMASVNNKVELEYSNNPYTGGTGSTAITPADESKVYTYNLALKKVKEDATPLTGAKFTLKRDGQPVFADLGVGTDGTLAFTGLDSDVEYELSETTVPAGMKSIDPIKFTITATKEADGTVTQVTASKTSDPSNAANFVNTTATDNVIDVTVTNIEGADLPLTGQQGIVAGVAVGGIVLTISLVAISHNRKRND